MADGRRREPRVRARLTAPFRDRIHLGIPVVQVRRDAHGVELVFGDGGSQRFDGVVIAAHADEALAMLEEPTETRSGCWAPGAIRRTRRCSTPTRPSSPPEQARAAWNYHLDDCTQPWTSATLNYWINRLQGLPTKTTIVSLNPTREPAEGAVARRLTYTHPVFTRESVATQAELPR